MNDRLSLLIGGVGIVKGSVKGLGPAMAELGYEMSASLKTEGWLRAAPFDCVSIIVRYGDSSVPEPDIGRVNRHGELEVATQASIDELRAAKGDVSALKEILQPYIHRCLWAVAQKFGLRAVNTLDSYG